MVYTELLRFNPWWEKKESITTDPHISVYEAEHIKYMPKVDFTEKIYVIRGPRQVGKTTLLKLRIRELLSSNIASKNIFYYSFDLVKTPEEIYKIVIEYLETIADEGKRHIFLDEITGVADWAKGIKLLIDMGKIKANDLVIVTGSSSIDLKKGSETLPGRGIEGNELYYLPCSFRTFLKLKNIELPAADLTEPEVFYKKAKDNMYLILTLKKQLSMYLETGGFLYSMNHGLNELTLERYARWLESDFTKWGKNPIIVKEILQGVIRKKCSQFSFHSIAKETSVTSHNTVIDYFSMLGEELFLRLMNKCTLVPFKIERKKEKKVYFLDPLLISLAEKFAGLEIGEPCKIEQAVAMHLSRIGEPSFYNDGKKEIDIVLNEKNGLVGIEVKWSNNIDEKDSIAVKAAAYPYLLSNEVLKKQGKVNVIPTALFLAMLDTKEFVKREVLAI